MSKTNANISRNAINHREAATRSRLSKNHRDSFVRQNSSAELKRASVTLSICKQEDNYFLDYVETWLGSSQKDLTPFQKESVKYNEYHAALSALLHNINFILNMQYFGTKNRFDKVIDFEYIKSMNFEYDAKIRSLSGCKTRYLQIKDSSQLNDMLINILKTSIELVSEFKNNVDIVKLLIESNSAYEEKIAKDNEAEIKLTHLAKTLIADLENNQIDLKVFSRAVSFESKKSTFNRSYV